MKKAILLIMGTLVLFGAIFISGCTNNSNKKEEDVSIPEGSRSVVDTSYEDNISGLQAFMKDRGYIRGDAKKMSSDFIGAKEGYRYEFASIITELYEFDLENLDSTATKTLLDIKEKGEFIILEETVPATISDNGKYVMIYTDNSNRENKDTRETSVKEGFKSFKSTN